MDKQKIDNKAGLIWGIANILVHDYKPHEYGNVILPFTVLRRFDSVLADTKARVLKVAEEYPNITPPVDKLLKKVAKQEVYNVSRFDFKNLLNEPDNIKANFQKYVNGFSDDVKEILSKERGFDFDSQIENLHNAGLLYLVIQKFSETDLHPDTISNIEMGYIFEEIIRKFSETYIESAGQFYTPREIIRLMADLLLCDEDEFLGEQNKIISIYDGAVGTGGMLSIASEAIKSINKSNEIFASGQEINKQTYAMCKGDMLLKGEINSKIKLGSTLSNDQFPEEKYDYIIMNPPFGTEWKKDENEVKAEFMRGAGGRFGVGLPPISDCQMLFLLNAIAKMKPYNEKSSGSRIAIIHNGSPLQGGDAGSGQSEIRRYVLENDLLEAIIQLPNNIFYNTGIATYIWILSNKKINERKYKVQLINASDMFVKRRKSLNEKKNDISDEQIEKIVKLYNNFKPSEKCKILDTTDFAYRKVVVLQPLLDENGKPILDKKGNFIPNKELYDTENIPFKEDVNEYMKREVLPFAPSAYIDESKTKIGYEIPFTKLFYKYTPPRDIKEIWNSIKELEIKENALMKELFSE